MCIRDSRKRKWRTEPTSVEKGGDEEWIAEKFQSNPEIAGSPRNSFRAVSYTHLTETKKQVPLLFDDDYQVKSAYWLSLIHICGRGLYHVHILSGEP